MLAARTVPAPNRPAVDLLAAWSEAVPSIWLNLPRALWICPAEILRRLVRKPSLPRSLLSRRPCHRQMCTSVPAIWNGSSLPPAPKTTVHLSWHFWTRLAAFPETGFGAVPHGPQVQSRFLRRLSCAGSKQIPCQSRRGQVRTLSGSGRNLSNQEPGTPQRKIFPQVLLLSAPPSGVKGKRRMGPPFWESHSLPSGWSEYKRFAYQSSSACCACRAFSIASFSPVF